jgi:hypothetical protein
MLYIIFDYNVYVFYSNKIWILFLLWFFSKTFKSNLCLIKKYINYTSLHKNISKLVL